MIIIINYCNFSYPEELIPFGKLKKWAETSVIKCVKDKIRLLALCSECFVNMCNDSVNWFTKICSRRHEIVWAKKNEHFYWPAKVLKKEENCKTVQFFVTHEIVNISSTNIIDYSNERKPNGIMTFERLNSYVKVSRI